MTISKLHGACEHVHTRTADVSHRDRRPNSTHTLPRHDPSQNAPSAVARHTAGARETGAWHSSARAMFCGPKSQGRARAESGGAHLQRGGPQKTVTTAHPPRTPCRHPTHPRSGRDETASLAPSDTPAHTFRRIIRRANRKTLPLRVVMRNGVVLAQCVGSSPLRVRCCAARRAK